MAGKSVAKYVVLGQGRVDGKAKMWVASTFASKALAAPWVALLNVAHKSGDAETVAKMDVHAPTSETGERPTAVRYSGISAQYNPDLGALSEDASLGD
jgi:hypothetical protein